MVKAETFNNQEVSNGSPDANPSAASLFENERNALETHLRLKRHDHHDLEPVKSKGEATFDLVTYKGIGWLGNALLSIYLADVFKNGAGKKYFDQAAESMAPKLQKYLGTSLEMATGSARSGLIMGGLIMGGTLLMYPIKKLEDNKLGIVTKLDDQWNKFSYGNNPVPDEVKEIQDYAHERIRKAPKQNWLSIIAGRIAGVTTVVGFAMGIAKGRDEKTADFIAEKLADQMKTSTSPMLRSLGKSTAAKNKISLAALDFTYSLVCEEILFHTTRAYGALVGKKKPNVTEAKNTAITSESIPAAISSASASDTASQNTPELQSQWDGKHTNWKERVNSLAPSYQDLALKRNENAEYLGMGA